MLATVPPWLALGGGAALLSAGLLLALRTPIDADPVLSPVADNSAEGRAARVLTRAQPWLYVVASAVLIAGLLLIPG